MTNPHSMSLVCLCEVCLCSHALSVVICTTFLISAALSLSSFTSFMKFIIVLSFSLLPALGLSAASSVHITILYYRYTYLETLHSKSMPSCKESTKQLADPSEDRECLAMSAPFISFIIARALVLTSCLKELQSKHKDDCLRCKQDGTADEQERTSPQVRAQNLIIPENISSICDF